MNKTKINYQTMEQSADGKYYPDYEKLAAGASCEDEKSYIENVAARAKFGFAYNMVYVTHQACGHFEIFQTPQNLHYPLMDVLAQAAEYAKTNKCTGCICGWKK